MASYLSYTIVRTLRGKVKRFSLLPEKQESTPFSEFELSRLEERQINASDSFFTSHLNNDNVRTNRKQSKFDGKYTIKRDKIPSSLNKLSMLNTFQQIFPDVALRNTISDDIFPLNKDNQYDFLSKLVIPLYQLPYQKQLLVKHQYAKQVLKKIFDNLKDCERPSYSLEPVYQSPEFAKYRNKDEFMVNIGYDGNPKTVGFYIISPNDKKVTCMPPTYLIHIKDSHKLVAKHFQNYIRNSSHSTCLSFETGGVWRSITVRSSQSGDLMAIVTVFSKDLKEDEFIDIKSSLKEYFSTGPGVECNLASLYFRPSPNSRSTIEEAPYELLFGPKCLEEECLGKKFNISPDSFFQINTKAAEILYTCILDIAGLTNRSTVLDICCGTGIISVISSSIIRGAIGLDASSHAIMDAKSNIVNNNIKNVNFICGDVENVLTSITDKLFGCSDVVAIVNPPQNGLPDEVMVAIRECIAIRRVVYVSSKNQGRIIKNFIKLCSLKKKPKFPVTSEPFVLKHAIPVDLFPNCLQLEIIFYFERGQNVQ